MVFGGGVDAQRVIDRGNQVVRMDGVGFGPGAVAVGLAVDLSRTHAAAGNEKTVALGPVVAPCGMFQQAVEFETRQQSTVLLDT